MLILATFPLAINIVVFDSLKIPNYANYDLQSREKQPCVFVLAIVTTDITWSSHFDMTS